MHYTRDANIKIKNNTPLYVIKYDQESPLKNHKYGEIAHDNLKEFYVHESFLVTYGTDSIVKAINSIL